MEFSECVLHLLPTLVSEPSSWYNIAVNPTQGIHCDFKFMDLIWKARCLLFT